MNLPTVEQYVQAELDNARSHLETFSAALEQHLSTDFKKAEDDLRALVAHARERVRSLEEELGIKSPIVAA